MEMQVELMEVQKKARWVRGACGPLNCIGVRTASFNNRSTQ